MKEWMSDDRPREKLIANGRSSLSLSELLAILIRTGTPEQSALDLARSIVLADRGRLDDLSKRDVQYFMKNFKGIGMTKAVSLVAALELSRRRYEGQEESRPKIMHSRTAYELFYKELSDSVFEEFWILLLSSSGRVLEKKKISEGGLSSTQVDVKKIMKYALDYRASGLILAHNHPSGNLSPSPQDFTLTERIKASAELLEIKVLDHLILSGDRYYSFCDEGVMNM